MLPHLRPVWEATQVLLCRGIRDRQSGASIFPSSFSSNPQLTMNHMFIEAELETIKRDDAILKTFFTAPVEIDTLMCGSR